MTASFDGAILTSPHRPALSHIKSDKTFALPAKKRPRPGKPRSRTPNPRFKL